MNLGVSSSVLAGMLCICLGMNTGMKGKDM